MVLSPLPFSSALEHHNFSYTDRSVMPPIVNPLLVPLSFWEKPNCMEEKGTIFSRPVPLVKHNIELWSYGSIVQIKPRVIWLYQLLDDVDVNYYRSYSPYCGIQIERCH
eukprot:TRINITY_DN61624_c0_g1_i1.p1 TRINITY_DN61624_c0_g1~~TRINITY_DN61624_c0_g1_i1.p1  ORF type:complete len:109 (-),score=7.96 TRINITY_DN61624_c0_g1_i1:1234-1560(-)